MIDNIQDTIFKSMSNGELMYGRRCNDCKVNVRQMLSDWEMSMIATQITKSLLDEYDIRKKDD